MNSKDKFVVTLQKLFFYAVCAVTIGGLVVFALVLIGTIIGGEAGSNLILIGQKKVVPIYEWIMGGAVLVGIISMYLSKTYAYKMDSKKDKAKKEEEKK